MATRESRTISYVLMQIALGCLLLISGIWGLQGGGDAAVAAIRHVFGKNFRDIMVIVFSIVELVAGIFLLLRLIVPVGTAIDTILMFIILIMWIIAIVLMDFLGSGGILNGGAKHFLTWLYNFAYHLLVLAAIIRIRW